MSEEQDIYADIDAAIDSELPDSPEPAVEPEVDAPVVEQEGVDAPTEEAELTPEQQEEAAARENGWKPKEDYTGDPSEWVSAAEFNRRKPFFEKIGAQNKEIKALQKKLDALANHTKTVEQKTREKVLSELKQKQRQAVSEMDTDTFDALEKEIEEVSKQELPDFDKEPEKPPSTTEIPEPVRAFAERNKWFEKDEDMTDLMVSRVDRLVRSGDSLEVAIEKAEKHVKSVFSHKFQNPNKNRPAAVMGGSGENRKAKGSIGSLTPEQKQVWHSLKGVMSEEEFLSQLESIA